MLKNEATVILQDKLEDLCIKHNLNFRLSGKIPVVFHNLEGYDCNFII